MRHPLLHKRTLLYPVLISETFLAPDALFFRILYSEPLLGSCVDTDTLFVRSVSPGVPVIGTIV